jgi:hypothetical protein
MVEETNEKKLAHLERRFNNAVGDLNRMHETGSAKAIAHAEWLVRKAYSEFDDLVEKIKYDLDMRLGNLWVAAREAYD